MTVPKRILPVIVFSQFAVTSLWFAGNAIIADLQSDLNVGIDEIGVVTSAIQLGFITGTLVFAFLSLSDRYSPRKIFLLCSILGAASNLMIYIAAYDLFSLLVLRFMTGFFLTGIYPVGMKIAAGWYREKLGNAIGLLVGALVLGTAFPHLIKSIGGSLPWQDVLIVISGFAVAGGIAMYTLVKDGPNIISGTKFNPSALVKIFRYKKLRSSAFGYFGHMWELYTFWALVPVILIYYSETNAVELNTSFWSFVIIASGSAGCIGGGIISNRKGSAIVAYTQLAISCACCLAVPMMLSAPAELFLLFLVLWGIVVVGDSPQYSAIIALSAPKEFVGSGLTLINSIGFAITIPSLYIIFNFIRITELPYGLMLLAAGPATGLYFMRGLLKKEDVYDTERAGNTTG